MAIPDFLIPIKTKAFERGWLLDLVPYGSAIDENGDMVRTVLAAGTAHGAYCFRRYHTEAHDADIAELTVGVREAIAVAGKRDQRERKAALARGERRSRAKPKSA